MNQQLQQLQPQIQLISPGSNILGKSKATQKLITQINLAAANLKPVLFQGQQGTGKSFLAQQIHANSSLASYPFAEFNCDQLPRLENGLLDTDLLFGRVGKQAGILERLQQGTLLLDHIESLAERDRQRLWYYLKTGYVLRNQDKADPYDRASETVNQVQVQVRLLLASAKKIELPDIELIGIKLLPLHQRRGDIPPLVNHFLDKFCQEQHHPRLQLEQTELRRLISYDYPGNVVELAEILHRAVLMTPREESVIPEQVLWSVQSTKNYFRLDLLTHLPWLRPVLLSSWYPQAIWFVMMLIFVPVTILGFIGPQTRDSSVTLNLFWAWWWPFSLLLFVFIGRFWCAVCPFMITAEWLRSFSLWLFPRQQLAWNKQWLNRWGAWLLFAGFLAIYLWEQLWDLPHHAYLSAWLLIAITVGAVTFSLIYERRLWCRYLCPIGGMNGLFAKLSIIELRSNEQLCASQCSTFGCQRGSHATPLNFANPLPDEGQATPGCPLYSHPAQLHDNRDCMFCMSCLKGCPNRSAQLNLRFPASDLLDNHQGFWAEAALLLLLFGGVFMHNEKRLLGWLGFENVPVNADHLLTSIPIALAFLAIPLILIYVTHAIANLFNPKQPSLLTIVYAYLPLTLAANLAHYIPAAVTEAGQMLPVLARSFGFSGIGFPTLTWSMDVAQFFQGATLLSALIFSPYPLFRITQTSLLSLSNLPYLILLVGLTGICFQLMI